MHVLENEILKQDLEVLKLSKKNLIITFKKYSIYNDEILKIIN